MPVIPDKNTCKACRGIGKSSKGRKCIPCGGTGKKIKLTRNEYVKDERKES